MDRVRVRSKIRGGICRNMAGLASSHGSSVCLYVYTDSTVRSKQRLNGGGTKFFRGSWRGELGVIEAPVAVAGAAQFSSLLFKYLRSPSLKQVAFSFPLSPTVNP